MVWTVYIIKCKDNSLYTGITTDINRRFYEHQNDDNKSSKYCLMRRPLVLVFKSRPFQNRSKASKEEYRIRNLTHEEKKNVIRNKSLNLILKNQLN